MLLLCGIDYMDVKFWGMDRKTFSRLISEKKSQIRGIRQERVQKECGLII